jgi:hypothetical protein
MLGQRHYDAFPVQQKDPEQKSMVDIPPEPPKPVVPPPNSPPPPVLFVFPNVVLLVVVPKPVPTRE